MFGARPSESSVTPERVFFQGEDGRRDKLVTGVQTCALPICRALRRETGPRARRRIFRGEEAPVERRDRSAERRVGKECRSRWPPYHYKQTRPLATQSTLSCSNPLLRREAYPTRTYS